MLTGAKALSTFAKIGGFWTASGQKQQWPAENLDCKVGYESCKRLEAVFLDNNELFQVMSLSQLSSGEFYFDYEADIIYLADDPTGRNVETTQTTSAILGNQGIDDVTISGLTIEKFASGNGNAALDTRKGDAWTIRNNEIRQTSGAGVSSRWNSVLTGNHIHHHGRVGVTGTGQNVLFQNNEVDHNNTAGYTGWAAGGSKWYLGVGITVRNNYFHHNYGSGIWTDVETKNILVEGNVSDNNGGHGISIEVSYNTVVRNNVTRDNGLNGIFISCSPTAEIYNNTASGNGRGGILLFQKDRGNGVWGPLQLENINVHDNKVTMESGALSGLRVASEITDNSYFKTRNIRFTNNTYSIPSTTSKSFVWDRGNRTRAEWVGYGLD